MTLTRPLLVCLIWLYALPALAQDLYSGMADVADQGASQRAQALPLALENVLQKLTGLTAVTDHPGVAQALSSAPNLLVATQYQQLPRYDLNGQARDQWVLVARFLPSAVDALMQELQLPRWSPRRASVLLWALLDDGQGVRFQPFEYQYAWGQLEETFVRLGLPVSWPGLGEETRLGLDVEAIWVDVVNPQIEALSGDEPLAVIRARRAGPEWMIDWSYREPEVAQPGQAALEVAEANEANPGSMAPVSARSMRSTGQKTGQQRVGAVFGDQAGSNGSGLESEEDIGSWQTFDTDLLQALERGAQQLVQRVARRNTLGTAGEGQWQQQIQVAPLAGARAYAQLLNYLSALPVVDGVDVLAVGQQGLTLALTLNAEPRYLGSSLNSDRLLVPVDGMGRYRMVYTPEAGNE